MRFIVTFYDTNRQKKMRFFKTLVDAKHFISNLREIAPGLFFDFQIKVIKP